MLAQFIFKWPAFQEDQPEVVGVEYNLLDLPILVPEGEDLITENISVNLKRLEEGFCPGWEVWYFRLVFKWGLFLLTKG